MSYYKLTDKEMTKLQEKFDKTVHGKKALFYSLAPYYLCICTLLIYLAISCYCDASEVVDVISIETFGLAAIIFVICLGVSFVTNMMYGNMLKDFYYATLEEKEAKAKKH